MYEMVNIESNSNIRDLINKWNLIREVAFGQCKINF